MKLNFKLRSFLAGSALFALSTQSHAAARYWDAISPTGSIANGGTGTWTQTGNTWRDANSGGGQVAYSSGTIAQQASFRGDAGTSIVTVSGTVYISGASTAAGGAGLYAADNTQNYSFDGTGTIMLGGAAYIHVNSNKQFGSGLTINNGGNALRLSAGGIFDSQITGAGSLTNGTLTVVLNNAGNNYSGGTDVTSGGTLSFVSGALGTTGDITVNGTGNLRWESGNTQDISSRIVMQTAGSATFNTNGNNVTFATGIGSTTSSRLNKTGNGALTLTGTNTYTGITTITTGTLQIGNGSTTGSIANTSSVTNNALLIYNRSNDLTASYAIGGTGTLEKQGAGKLTLTNTNGYSGATTISAGTLALGATGSIANTSGIYLTGATAKFNVTTANFALGASQTLGGIGTVENTGRVLTASGTLAPGNSPGTLTVDGGTMALANGGDYSFQILNASGAAGTGYDTTDLINGATLDLSALAAAGYTINLQTLASISPDVPGNAIFNNTQSYSWTLFSTTTSLLSAFDANDFAINPADFTNALGGGAFSVGLADSNTNIVLNFTAVPEPRAALLGSLGLLVLLRRRRH